MPESMKKAWRDIIFLPVAGAGLLAESLNLSYRQVQNWDCLGALPCSRCTARGWRRFSIADILMLNISLELRALGLSLAIISKINKSIIANDLLEDAFMQAVNLKKDVCLWTGLDGEAMILQPENDMNIIWAAGKDERARIFLPIARWVRELADAAGWKFNEEVKKGTSKN